MGRLRTYLYVSDAKVDMYLAQIDAREKTRIAAKLGVNIGVFSASLEAETASLGNRMTRLNTVEEVLRRDKKIGPVNSTSSWIGGVAMVAAATFPDHPELMFFFSKDDDQFLGLAGSAHHILGNVRATNVSTSLSHQGSLLSTILSVVTTSSYVIEKEDRALLDHIHMGVSASGLISEWTRLLVMLSDRFDAIPKQKVDFLARQLVSEVVPGGRRYVLATPLYIALEDD